MADKKSKAPTAKQKAVARADGWTSIVKGLGQMANDPRMSMSFKVSQISDTLAESLYTGNGMARRILTLPPIEMTRNWFRINGDEEDIALQKLEELGAQEAYTDAMTWARLFGGAVILMGLNDSRNMWRPVNPEKIREVMYLRVFDRTDVEIDHQSVSTDPTDPLFGQPTKYRITPVTGGNPFDVHASRLIRFDGAKLSNHALQNNNGWHDSVLTAIYDQIRAIGAVYDSAEFITNDFVQTIIRIKNLLDLVMAGKDDVVKARLNLIDLSKHTSNTILLDENETYEKHSSTVTGLDTLLDRFMMYVSSVIGIPVTKLMGRSPAGQNATGDSDMRMWYDDVRSGQRSNLRPRIEPLISYIYAAGGNEPETWSIEFNPLVEPTEKEKSEVYKLNAEGDAIYIDTRVANPDDVRKYRFGGQAYNPTPPTFEDDEIGESGADISEEERAALAAEAAAAEAAARESTQAE